MSSSLGHGCETVQRQTLRSSSTKSIRRDRPREVKLVNHVPPAGAAEESEARQPRPRCVWSNSSTGSLLLGDASAALGPERHPLLRKGARHLVFPCKGCLGCSRAGDAPTIGRENDCCGGNCSAGAPAMWIDCGGPRWFLGAPTLRVANSSRSSDPAGPLVCRFPQATGAPLGEESSVVKSIRGALVLQAHDPLRPS